LLMGDVFFRIWFEAGVVFAILGVFALLFYIFLAIPHNLRSRLSLRWQWALKGIAVGFGLTYLIVTPIQIFFLIPYIKYLAAGHSAGLESLVITMPSFVAIFAGPFISALFGYIGYRSGKSRELEGLLQEGESFPRSESIRGIVLDTIGIFGFGLLGFILFLYLIEDPLGRIAHKDNVQLALYFRQVIFWLALPTFAFLGFYTSRLFQRRQVKYQTIFAIFLVFSFVVSPYFLTWYLRESSMQQQQFVKSHMSIGNFEESVIVKDNALENELNIMAQMNVPAEKEYSFDVYLSDVNGDPLFYGLGVMVKTENRTGNVAKLSDKIFFLREGIQPIIFTLNFSQFFKAHVHPSYRGKLLYAIENNAVAMDITIGLYGGGISGEQVYRDQYIISRKSFEELGLIRLLQERQNQ